MLAGTNLPDSHIAVEAAAVLLVEVVAHGADY